MLLSDNPTHRLFVLLGPVQDKGRLPMPLAVIQISLEGLMNTEEVEKKLLVNQREDGNMVPWLLAQQYLTPEFSKLTTSRVVRVAANPYYSRQGYGSKALAEYRAFFEGNNLQ